MDNTLTKNTISIPLYDEFLRKVNSHPNKSTNEILFDLKKNIAHYEKKYNMLTEEFLPRFRNGEFEMDDNFPDYELAHWQGSYEAYQRLSETKEIEHGTR